MTADSPTGLAQLFDERHDTPIPRFLARPAHAPDALDQRQESLLRSPETGDAVNHAFERLFTPDNAAAEMDRDLGRRRLAAVIRRLPPRCRAALVMRYRDELGYRAIGERLNMSTPVAKQYVVKALAACRVGMARYD